MALVQKLADFKATLPKKMWAVIPTPQSSHEDCDGAGYLYSPGGKKLTCSGCEGRGMIKSSKRIVPTRDWFLTATLDEVQTAIIIKGLVFPCAIYETEAEAVAALNGAKNV